MTNEEPENQTLPLIMHGHKVTPIFLALVGPVLIFVGLLAVYLSIINFQDLVLFQKIVVPLLNIVGILAGGAMVYSLLRKFPYKTIFTADEMIQHYLTHTHTRSIRESWLIYSLIMKFADPVGLIEGYIELHLLMLMERHFAGFRMNLIFQSLITMQLHERWQMVGLSNCSRHI